MLDIANYTPRLQGEYKSKIRDALKDEFGYKNDMMIPKLEKIVLNIGCCLLYTSPSPRDGLLSRMPSSA